MQLLICSVLFLVAVVRLSRASFYDNPALELPPAGGTPLDELEKKWGTDVSPPPSYYEIKVTAIMDSDLHRAQDRETFRPLRQVLALNHNH